MSFPFLSLLMGLIACFVAYLIGSVSFAVLSARLFKLADPRTYGSGNPGATNVLRTGNTKAALFTVLGDTLKGVAAVRLAAFLGLDAWIVGLVGLAAFFGHLFPVFLKFKGGKGVATAGGVLLALEPLAGFVTLGAWILSAFLTRYASLASIIAAVSAPAWILVFAGSDGALNAAVVAVMSLTLTIKHWGNIRRLLAGQETKIGGRKKT
jgi:glycerol-3-phosphate acyltransferase PlsY